MTSNPQAPEAMEWQREGAEDQRRVTEEGGQESEGGDELPGREPPAWKQPSPTCRGHTHRTRQQAPLTLQ